MASNPKIGIEEILYVVVSALAISTMVNAPAILLGYGLVYAVALYAALRFPPGRAAVLFGIAHTLAVPVLLATKSIFLTVAVASLALRPPVLYLVARLRRSLGDWGTAALLVALDQFVALTIAIGYYGDDGIHVGLTIYEAILALYTVPLARTVDEGNYWRAAGIAVALAAYYLSVVAFLSAPLLLSSLAALAVSTRAPSRYVPAALAIVLVGALVGGQALSFNLEAAAYPFKPSSWTSERWSSPGGDGCPETDNVFADTHSPARLRIIKHCVTVRGTVTGAPGISGDGDYSFDLIPDPEYRHMLAIGNLVLRKGALHVEVVPADHFRVLDPVGGGLCPGDRVEVTGVFVVDTDHGMWAEVHPAHNIVLLEREPGQAWPDCIRGKMLEYGG